MRDRFKFLPLTVMLIAGAITGVATLLLHYKSTTALWVMVGVLVLFYIIGTILQKVILKFEKEIAEEEARKAEEEGKVVEKDGVVTENEEETSEEEQEA